MECSRCTLGPKELKVECPFQPRSWSKAKSFEGCRSLVRMTMHEVVYEMVVGECHELNSEGSGSSWKAYMNARVAGYSFGAAPLMSPRQDETSEPLLYAGRMAGPYRCKDATRGLKDDFVTSGPCRSEPIECSNCKVKYLTINRLESRNRALKARLRMLEARLEMERNPEDHACQSGAILNELLDDMEDLHME
ncbi:hypothetical protein Tco_1464137 [Tanacetum coccineum]